jgi:hypothetical protein
VTDVTDWTVTPPAQGEWYDLATVVDAVLEQSRLNSFDFDRPWVERLVPVAAEQINNRLDRAYPLTPLGAVDTDDADEDGDVTEVLATNVTQGILDALRDVTIELYMRRGPNRPDIPVNESISAVDAAAPDLEYAHKSRWGLA